MNKVYAFSDIHGMYNLWKQIDRFCDETDKLVFLGDAADRGPDGLKVIAELLADKRVTYLKGNHEDMLVKVGSDLLEGRTSNILLWYQNGGEPTASTLLGKPENIAWEYIHRLNKLPEVYEYTNKDGKKIILSHAGCPITDLEKYRMWGKGIDYLWDRDHLTWDYENEMTDEMPIIVHGHTPVPVLPHYGICPNHYTQVYKYCAGHKIDIDLGCFATKKIALLDLDTLEPIYFEEKE